MKTEVHEGCQRMSRAHESCKGTLSFGKGLERTHVTVLGHGAKHAVCSHHSGNNSC